VVEEEDDDELPVDESVEYDFDGVHDESEPIHRVWAEVRAAPVPHIVPPALYHDSGYPSNICDDGADDDVGDDGDEPPAGWAVFLGLPDLLTAKAVPTRTTTTYLSFWTIAVATRTARSTSRCLHARMNSQLVTRA